MVVPDHRHVTFPALAFALVAAMLLLVPSCAAPSKSLPEDSVEPATTAPVDRLLLDSSDLLGTGWELREGDPARATIIEVDRSATPCDGDLSAILAASAPRDMASRTFARGPEVFRQVVLAGVDERMYDRLLDYYLDCEGVVAPVTIGDAEGTISNDIVASGPRAEWIVVDTSIETAVGSQASSWLFAHLHGDVLLTHSVVSSGRDVDTLFAAARIRAKRDRLLPLDAE